MGSLDGAVLTGFICRLCSEMHRVVLHIYSEEGIRLRISEKISRYLSINVCCVNIFSILMYQLFKFNRKSSIFKLQKNYVFRLVTFISLTSHVNLNLVMD